MGCMGGYKKVNKIGRVTRKEVGQSLKGRVGNLLKGNYQKIIIYKKYVKNVNIFHILKRSLVLH